MFEQALDTLVLPQLVPCAPFPMDPSTVAASMSAKRDGRFNQRIGKLRVTCLYAIQGVYLRPRTAAGAGYGYPNVNVDLVQLAQPEQSMQCNFSFLLR